MPSERYALRRGETERLEVTWKPGYEDTTVVIDGETVGSVAAKHELKKGQIFPLPDGTLLSARLVVDYFGFSLDLRRNGRPLPNSRGDLLPPHETAYRIFYLLAGIHLGGGLYLASAPDAQQGPTPPAWTLFTGFLYLLFGMYVHRRSSRALVAGAAVYAGDGVRSIVAALLAGDPVPVMGLVLRVVLIAGMVRGVRATRKLPRKARSVPPLPGLQP